MSISTTPHEPRPTTITLERRWLPDAEGGLTRRVTYTDVVRSVSGASACDFDWGNAGPGAHELALNVLEAALLAISHQGPRSAALEGTCFTLGLLLRGSFVASFLTHMPDEGGVLSLSEVIDWTLTATRALDPDTSALLAPRYRLEGASGEHWSFAELLQIMDAPLTIGPDGIYDGPRRIAIQCHPHPVDAAAWEGQPI